MAMEKAFIASLARKSTGVYLEMWSPFRMLFMFLGGVENLRIKFPPDSYFCENPVQTYASIFVTLHFYIIGHAGNVITFFFFFLLLLN